LITGEIAYLSSIALRGFGQEFAGKYYGWLAISTMLKIMSA
jgi:hypothetical protein